MTLSSKRWSVQLVASAVAVAALAVVAWPLATPSRAQVPAPAQGTFDAALVQHGAELAAVGNCIDCHTAPGGRAYGGGRALTTPFGTLYGTNITPDADTGIGRWTEAAFVRAMREGIDAEGRRLYPAFPYDHFTLVTDGDLHALYAFLMTRDPVHAQRPHNELRFPFNMRPLLAVWQALYLERMTFGANPQQSEQWNRGAYLVMGLAHCGACHTPRNKLGAEKRDRALSGGEAEGWHAPAIDASSPAPVPWTADALYAYLRNGVAQRHDAAGGPMAPVTHNLGAAADADVRAIAVYVASLAPKPPSASAPLPRGGEAAADGGGPVPQPTGDRTAEAGRAVYESACASCHDQARGGFYRGALSLRLSSALRVSTADNAVRIILHGIAPPAGEQGPWMPAFAGALDDSQVQALVHYLRTSVAAQPAWQDVDRAVRTARAAPAS